MTARFDRFAERYEAEVERSISFAGQEHAFYLEAKAERLLDLVRRHVGDPAEARALDVGCGIGVMDEFLAGAFGELCGTDVSSEAIERARLRNPGVRYDVQEEDRVPHPDERFDVAFAVCVLHHVARAGRPALMAELRRVTRAGGLVVVFEHNPWNPLTRLAVRNCAFDRGVELLRAGSSVELLQAAGLAPVERAFMLFFPSRRDWLRRLERRLASLPLGAQYLVAARRSG